MLETPAKNFMGNIALYAAPRIAVIDCTSFLPVALALTTAIAEPDTKWFTDCLEYLSSLRDPSTLTSAFTLVNGPDFFMTSWQRSGMEYDWGIPSPSDGKPSAIRKPGIGSTVNGEEVSSCCRGGRRKGGFMKC